MEDSLRGGGARADLPVGDYFRAESARLVALLAGHLGLQHLQLAEDAVQEALVRALQTWPYRGAPANPSAWLMQTAKNLALDQLRRERRFLEKQDGIAAEHGRWLARPVAEDDQEPFTDHILRLMFVCFHPLLSPEVGTALALRTLCGLSAAEIAAAFVSSEAAVEKRLVRARQRIRDLEIPFAVPEAGELPARLDGVLGTLYLLFNEGYKASGGDRLVREDLCREAIRLVELVATHPATAAPRTHALHSLMLLNAARLPARTDDSGNLLRLHEQDRTAWDAALIQRGVQALARAATGDSLSGYHLEAAIAVCHSTAPDDASTDWPRILSLYDRLVAMSGSPVAALNRAVAVARVHGPRAGLDAANAITNRASLESYHLFHAVRGALAAELGLLTEALTHFRMAGDLAGLPAERDFIARRIRECESRRPPQDPAARADRNADADGAA